MTPSDTAHPEGEMTRETVARIVDPEAFDLIEHYNGLPQSKGEGETFRVYPQLKARRDAAYEKADAILALRPVARPQGEEGLAELVEDAIFGVLNEMAPADEKKASKADLDPEYLPYLQAMGRAVAAALSNQGRPVS